MAKKSRSAPRREESLSRERIIDASIALLDARGEAGLTFRNLSEKLATGPGAIYGHIAHKSDLLTAAADGIVARTLQGCSGGATPEAHIRSVALALFDAIDAHPWVGSAITQSPGQLPVVRILESLGQQVRALGVSADRQWGVVSALLHYILGVGGQNAANGQIGRTAGLDRTTALESVSATWLQLDPQVYPFTLSVAGQLSTHDDRGDFLAGIDLILGGIAASLAG